jgi:4-hydroxy-tetrahydrodipicolinate synthase
MATHTDIGGLWAALLIPRDAAGDPDERALRRTIEFLVQRGVSNLVLNGATGEYCLTTRDELERLLAVCRETLDGRGAFLCGIGAAGVRGSIALGHMALDGGARALLLPMPHFFPYAQEDLIAYCQTVAGELEAPILLYNLPRFTTPIEASTVQFLVETVPNIVGLKDSSGSLDLLRGLPLDKASRIVGDDRALVAALDAGVCDGVISGVAGVLPELMRFLFGQRGSARYAEVSERLNALIESLSLFPTPWGLKLIAGIRGIAPAHFAQPLSGVRSSQARDFEAWFEPWWHETQRVLAQS